MISRFAPLSVLIVTLLSFVTSSSPGLTQSSAPPAMDPPEVTIAAPLVVAPPDSFFEMIEDRLNNPRRRSRRSRSDRDPTSDEDSATKAARIQTELQFYRAFYQKYLEVNGLPVAAHQDVSDLALQRTHEIVSHMLAGRPDILESMAQNQTYLIVIGKNQVYTDMPEYRGLEHPEDIDHTLRWLPYHPKLKTLVVDQNHLMAPSEGHQVVRLMAEALYQVTAARPHEPDYQGNQQYELRVQRMDERFDSKLERIYQAAMSSEKWRNTAAVHNKVQYWTNGVLAYFDAAAPDGTPIGQPHPITTREDLRNYDPRLFELVNQTMAYDGKIDWRLSY